MDSDTFDRLLITSFLAMMASVVAWVLRPDLRKSKTLRILLGASVTVFLLLVGLFALLIVSLTDLDMSEF